MDKTNNSYSITFDDSDLDALMHLIDAGCRHLGANATGAAYRWQTLLFNAQKSGQHEAELFKVDKQPATGADKGQAD